MLVSDRTVASEAKKSSRVLAVMMILILAIIGGSIAVYMKRHEVVAFVEQYTGPLNLLEADQPAEPTPAQLEEERREKVRQLYMLNTLRIQNRDSKFLSKLDSLARTNNPKLPRITSVVLEGSENAFELALYGKTAKEIKDFTKTLYEIGWIESIRPDEPQPNRKLAGYRFFSVASGSVRVPPAAEGDSTVDTHYGDVAKVKKTVFDLAAKYNLKASEQDEMNMTRDVAMTKHRLGLRLEGASVDFLKYIRQINSLSLNIEQLKHGIVYGDPKDKRRKPDVMELDFNILIPVLPADGTASSSAP